MFDSNTIGNSLSKLGKAISGIKNKGQQALEYIISTGEDFDIKLDIIGEEKIVMENDITDNYVETNVAYQDHISVKPTTYTLTGEVGELVWYRKDENESILQALPTKLTSISTFVPPVTGTVSSVRDKVMKISNFLDSADNFLNRMSKLSDKKTMQEQIFEKIKAKRDERALLNIKTPWTELKNYAITRCEFNQPDDSKDKTTISITFKEMRLTSISAVPFNAKKYRGMEQVLRSPKTEKGKTTGLEKKIDLKKYLKGEINLLEGL